MAEGKEYLLGNRAKELYIYTRQTTQPVADEKVEARDVARVMRTIAQAKNIDEMRGLLSATAERLEKRHQRRRFPKSESFGMIADLRQCARNIVRGVHAANETNFKEHPEDRLREIKAVIDECNLHLQLVEISHELEYIDTKRMGTWTKKILDVKHMCLAWLKKDGARAINHRNEEERKETERLVRLVREILAEEGKAQD